MKPPFNPDVCSQKLAEFIKQFGPTFPVGVVDQGFVGPYSQITPDMRPTVPIIFFIDCTFISDPSRLAATRSSITATWQRISAPRSTNCSLKSRPSAGKKGS